MDRFEVFAKYLAALLSERPRKIVGDAACGYWQAIESVSRAAEVALKNGSENDASDEHGSGA